MKSGPRGENRPGRADAETGKRHTIKILLWPCKSVFMFDKVSQDGRSFGVLPRKAWTILDILELALLT